jgi:ribosomal-protein-alanine N-acetyltransferase
MEFRMETDRLILRLFEASDAKRVQALAGVKEVADTALSIPYPYPDGVAEAWIERTRNAALTGDIFAFALLNKLDNALIGCVSLRVAKSENKAELAYWIGQAFWGQGFATESSQAVVNFGFEYVGLNSIHAAAMVRNPASYKVMEKIGMKAVDNVPKQIIKSGVYEDLVHYEIIH